MGSRIVDETLKQLLPLPLHRRVFKAASSGEFAHGLEACSGVGGFGAVLGRSISETLGIAPQNNGTRPGAEWAGLWNLLVAYFDDLCDEYRALFPKLMEHISSDALKLSLTIHSGHRLSPDPGDHELLQFVVYVADEVFSRMRKHGEEISRSDYRWLAQSVMTAYRAEVASADLRFSRNHSLKNAHNCLRCSNSLPVWILGNGAALADGTSDSAGQLDSALHHVGDILWYWDDLVDLEDDVGTDRWNAALLVAADTFGPGIVDHLLRLDPEKRIEWVYQNKADEILADRLLNSYVNAIQELEAVCGSGSPLARDLTLTLNCFAEEVLGRPRSTVVG